MLKKQCSRVLILSLLLAIYLPLIARPAGAGLLDTITSARQFSSRVLNQVKDDPQFWQGLGYTAAGALAYAAAGALSPLTAGTSLVPLTTLGHALVKHGLTTAGLALGEAVLVTAAKEVLPPEAGKIAADSISVAFSAGGFFVPGPRFSRLINPKLARAFKGLADVADSLDFADSFVGLAGTLIDSVGGRQGVQQGLENRPASQCNMAQVPPGSRPSSTYLNYRPELYNRTSYSRGQYSQAAGHFVVSYLNVRGHQYQSLLLRSSPGTGTQRNIIGRFRQGDTLQFLGETVTRDGWTWIRVRASDGREGWVVREALAWVDAPPPPVARAEEKREEEPPPSEERRFEANFVVNNLAGHRTLNFRSGPGVRNSVTDSLRRGDQLQFLGGRVNRDGWTWVNVRTGGGQEGWVVEAALKKT